ncbi:hypothetical protein CK203_104099 [Vitis vinifera]|uniref:Retrotransposon gag domain-containing protein n=2 Tax=Vitis vinifera TaxID=29760 RepID=A0A438EQP2_VITVI|nr:hypothetical protein CK203_104099 [Vitis vinifera]
MHYRQLMTLDIGNDALLCKVFPASLQGQALSWFHRLPPNSVGNFRDLSEAFVGQYLCSARHKQNISTLQNIKMQDNESLREFVKRFGKPYFKRANKYSMLEDDVRAATQQVLVAGRPSRSNTERNTKPPDRPKPSDRRQEGPSRPEMPPLTPLSISYEKLLPMIQACPTSSGLDPLERTHPQGIVAGDVPSTKIMAIQQRHADLSSIWQFGRSCASIGHGHMGHTLTGLENPGRILSGFNGSSTTSLGDIVLPVQAGPVTLNVQFSVVQELSPFNVILGRTWLHYMKAIPSTYHQMVSFLTNDGQIDLYGSQLAARQCYQIAREAGANQEDASPPEPSIAHDQ